MNSIAVLLAPIVLLLPALAVDMPRPGVRADEAAHNTSDRQSPATGFDAAGAEPFRALQEARRPPLAGQVRIEQRVIIRIAPSSPAVRERMLAELPRRAAGFEERRMGGCVEIDDIAGVQPAEENRLLLFMRDRRVLTAALERTCKSEDYYSGFYLERNADGQLCPRRDQLQSRAGASCRVAQFHRLVAARN
jgi:hypothetical protein